MSKQKSPINNNYTWNKANAEHQAIFIAVTSFNYECTPRIKYHVQSPHKLRFDGFVRTKGFYGVRAWGEILPATREDIVKGLHGSWDDEGPNDVRVPKAAFEGTARHRFLDSLQRFENSTFDCKLLCPPEHISSVLDVLVKADGFPMLRAGIGMHINPHKPHPNESYCDTAWQKDDLEVEKWTAYLHMPVDIKDVSVQDQD